MPKVIFSKLLKLKPGKGGEIHITDAIRSLIKNDEKFIAHNFNGKYLDCGTMDGYIRSSWRYQNYEIMYDWNWLCWSCQWGLFFRYRKYSILC